MSEARRKRSNVKLGDFVNVSCSSGLDFVCVVSSASFNGEDVTVDPFIWKGNVMAGSEIEDICGSLSLKHLKKINPNTQCHEVVLSVDRRNQDWRMNVETLEYFWKVEMVKSLLLDRVISTGCHVNIKASSLKVEAINESCTEEFFLVNRKTKLSVKRRDPDVPIKLSGKVGGLDDIMDSLRLCVDMIGMAATGILLKGSPGTGKTSLVHALCHERNLPLFALHAGDMLAPGSAESAIELAFKDAADEAKDGRVSVIFIDEIDVICSSRDDLSSSKSSSVLSLLLSLMDGVVQRDPKIIVIAATNNADSIDSALRRPGRFDKEIFVPIPNVQQRLEVLKVHCEHYVLAKDVNLQNVAQRAVGYVGADIVSLCREALYRALEEEREEVSKADFDFALTSVAPSPMRAAGVDVPSSDWDEIGGHDSIKTQLKQAIEWPITRAKDMKVMDISLTRGVMLYGPPGCAKTTLVRALASNIHASFFVLSSASVFSPYVGSAEKIVRDTFELARSVSPAIVFIDEMEAVVGKRQEGSNDSGNKVQERVLSTLLNEMDGVDTQAQQVVVVGATNRIDLVDDALLRPGRFDYLLFVSPPQTQHERMSILKVHTRKMPLAEDVSLESIAERTEGYSGADLEAVCKEAAMLCLRQHPSAQQVSMEYFNAALKQSSPSLSKVPQEMMVKLF